MEPAVIPQTLFDFTRVNTAFAGLASGIAGTCFGHPLELIKVRLQAQREYKGSWDCLVQSMKSDGVSGLFRGVGPPLLGSSIINVVAFSSYNLFNDMQRDHKRGGDTEIPPPRLSWYNYSLSGFGVGISCAPFVCPIEVVKTRMQLDRGGKKGSKALTNQPLRRYKGSWDCFKTILRSEGVRGLYTGFSTTTIRDVSYSITYFSVYEPLKQFLRTHLSTDPASSSFSPLPVILSAGVCGALAWTSALPFDCAKTLIQQETNGPGNANKGVVKEHYRKFGLRGFYSGWIPTILRAFAVSATRFLVYESTLYWLNNFWKKRNGN
jgi:solute carrier family 25 carnitine/acylcarnitine transporter 20/29